MTNNCPIGIFDSGIGGLSIYKQIKKILPNENTVYLADNLNAPYGKKSKEQIIKFSLKNTKKLIDLNCKLIVVACNTATTNAITVLRDKFDIPIVGIEPSVKPAIANTKTKSIGILATEKTLTSNLFQQTSNKFSGEVTIHEQIGYELVSIIEERGIDEGLLKDKLKNYIEPMLKKNIDTLVLGCTHYYYLKDILRKILPENVKVLDSSFAVSKRVKQVLEENKIISETLGSENKFYCNGDKVVIKEFLMEKEKINKIFF